MPISWWNWWKVNRLLWRSCAVDNNWGWNPPLAQRSRKGQRTTPGSQPRKCYECGMLGHIAWTCPTCPDAVGLRQWGSTRVFLQVADGMQGWGELSSTCHPRWGPIGKIPQHSWTLSIVTLIWLDIARTPILVDTVATTCIQGETRELPCYPPKPTDHWPRGSIRDQWELFQTYLCWFLSERIPPTVGHNVWGWGDPKATRRPNKNEDGQKEGDSNVWLTGSEPAGVNRPLLREWAAHGNVDALSRRDALGSWTNPSLLVRSWGGGSVVNMVDFRMDYWFLCLPLPLMYCI